MLEGRPKDQSTEQYATNRTAIARISVPEDVAKVVGGFLTCPNAEFMTGQTFVVDRGIIFT
jgi:NAD(P)-dependent dehydrogenase (short-subunit alcohol dehydrogenase family)